MESLANPSLPGRTEASYITFWYDCFLKQLQTFCPSAQYDRNTNRGTSTDSNRPDYVLLINNIAIFRGEEKGPDSVENPIVELKDKVNWTYNGTK